jgi:hypothetical protein
MSNKIWRQTAGMVGYPHEFLRASVWDVRHNLFDIGAAGDPGGVGLTVGVHASGDRPDEPPSGQV